MRRTGGIKQPELWKILVMITGLVLSLGPSLVLADDEAIAGAKMEEDDPAINARGTLVNRVLLVLRHDPDSASEACITTLNDMHKAQDQLEEVEKHEEDSDIGLVRDVLASDMEEAITKCGADAAKICRHPSPDLVKLCSALPEMEDEETP